MWKKKNLPVLFLVLAAVFFCFYILQNKERYMRPYDYDYFGRLYSESQYVKGQLSKGGIGDDGLYAFAGHYYISGGDISQVNFENPPLGKYLIGLSAILFNNELVINLIYALALFFIVYKLSLCLDNHKNIAALAVLWMSIDPLITNHFAISLLDLPMTVFFLLGIYCYVRAWPKPSNKWLLFSAFSFAISFVCRFFPFLPVVLLILSLALVKKGKGYAGTYTLFWVTLLPIIYLFSHASYLFYHPSLIDFLRYQKWIIDWRLTNPVKIGNIIPTLFTGRYQSWWGNNSWLVAPDWSILTPIALIFGMAGFFSWRHKFPHAVLFFLVISFLIYVAVGTVGVAKFILPVYPLLIIAGVSWAFKILHTHGVNYGRD